jgi:hypothetical protein
MKSFFELLLQRLGYTGDPGGLCISALPAWPLLFLTGTFIILAISLLLRSFFDMLVPASVTQRIVGSRAMVQWSLTATLVGLLAGATEAVGAQQRAETADWLQSLGSAGHPMAVTGLAAMASGMLMALRAMALLQVQMFNRAAASSGPRGIPGDGAFVQASGFALRGFTSGDGFLRKPGGGMPAAILGVILAAYGAELLRQVDLCL